MIWMEMERKVDLVRIDPRHFERREKNGNIVDNMVFNDDMDSSVQPKKIQRIVIQMERMHKVHPPREEVSLSFIYHAYQIFFI